MPVASLTGNLVTAFNRRKPVRAGSLIVTLYGDAIVPRGGSLSLGNITGIMGLFKIDNGHVRTAISRLTSEKWLERKKVGRNTFYRLSRQGEGEFAEATKRIYFPRGRDPQKSIRLALLNGEASGRAGQRKKLEAAGYAAFNALTYVAASADHALKGIKGVHVLDVPASDESIEILRTAFGLDDIAARYAHFIAQFQPLRAALGSGEKLSDAEALVVRLLLIQEFRRIVLRDPALPPGMLAANWQGQEARHLAGEVYRGVLGASERYLDQCYADEKNLLPKPNPSLRQRFAAAQ
jgi:phenylacetic acid degradation operon negative regulatory protein